MNSRSKGARGEREAAAAWSLVMGGGARRGQQFSGSPDSPDVVTDYPGIHLESKRVERGNPYEWLSQAVADAGGKVPVVLHRRNRQEWVVVMRLSDVPKFVLEASAGPQVSEVGRQKVPGPVPDQGQCPSIGKDG